MYHTIFLTNKQVQSLNLKKLLPLVMQFGCIRLRTEFGAFTLSKEQYLEQLKMNSATWQHRAKYHYYF